MDVIPLEIWREIFSFRTYEDLVLSGIDDPYSLKEAMKKQYGCNSIMEYIRLKIKKEQIFYVPDDLFEDLCDKIPRIGHQFIYLTRNVIEKYVPGIGEVMRLKSLEITPKAMLSRAIAGIRKKTLIINLPGSPKGACENLDFVMPALKHGIEIMTGEASECATK